MLNAILLNSGAMGRGLSLSSTFQPHPTLYTASLKNMGVARERADNYTSLNPSDSICTTSFASCKPSSCSQRVPKKPSWQSHLYFNPLHVPRPLQSFGHTMRRQRAPVNWCVHTHRPFSSQKPPFMQPPSTQRVVVLQLSPAHPMTHLHVPDSCDHSPFTHTGCSHASPHQFWSHVHVPSLQVPWSHSGLHTLRSQYLPVQGAEQ